MKLLGAILAGGQARRFGSDKAHARYEGFRLIDRVAEALAAQCDAVIVCGREEPGYTCVPDRPEPDLGPLGGLNAALHYAEEQGFDAVLSAGCDIPNLPPDLAEILGAETLSLHRSAIVQSQPVVGLWPVGIAKELEAFLADDGRALYGFAEKAGARMVRFDPPLMNINRPEDLG